MAPHRPTPAVMAASLRTAARVTLGAISLSRSSHFPPKPYSYWTKPVALPPGRARLSTKLAPTGSATSVNIIGTVRVACSNGPTCAVPLAKMTSGASATNSATYLRVSSASPKAPKRYSIRKLRPSLQPNSSSRCRNVASQTCTSESAAPDWSTPIRRIRSACCARAATGHTAAAPPRSVMKLRRLTGQHLPCLRKDSTPQLWQETAALRDFAPARGRVRVGGVERRTRRFSRRNEGETHHADRWVSPTLNPRAELPTTDYRHLIPDSATR